MRQALPRRVGLTGGIGAGKSQAAECFRRAGLPVLDLDEIGREVTDIDAALLSRLEALCGTRLVDNGKLDRRRLRELLFADAKLRTAVEKLLHPIILQRFETLAMMEAKRGARLLICEAALLVESGYASKLDGLLVITAPRPLRKQRLMARDRLTDALAEQILAAQASDDERLRQATWVVENEGTLPELEEKLAVLMGEWKKKGWI